MKTITFYKRNGEIEKEVPLNEITVKDCHGMKIKCTLIDGSEHVGFANPYYSIEEQKIIVGANAYLLGYITLETFAHLDEETHTFLGEDSQKYDINSKAIAISLITHIDAILYSGLRWGVVPTNKFDLKPTHNNHKRG